MTNDPATRLVAVCDACALYSITMADLLTSLGEAGLFHPRWTNKIHEEWIRNVIENRGPSGTLTREKLEARRDAMIEAIENSLIEEYEDLIPTLTLPDADDRPASRQPDASTSPRSRTPPLARPRQPASRRKYP